MHWFIIHYCDLITHQWSKMDKFLFSILLKNLITFNRIIFRYKKSNYEKILKCHKQNKKKMTMIQRITCC